MENFLLWVVKNLHFLETVYMRLIGQQAVELRTRSGCISSLARREKEEDRA